MASTAGMAFVTLATHRHRPIFDASRLAELFIETLLHYRSLGRYKLHAFLVMRDHVHLLLSPEGIPLDSVIALIQAGFAEHVTPIEPIWEHGFNTYPVRSLRDLEMLRSHLHQLPVRANITPTAELYPYSSAHRLA